MRAFVRTSLFLLSCLGGLLQADPVPFDTGVNIHIDSSERLSRVAELGARWVRMDVNWDRLEVKPGHWDYRSLDTVLDRCEALDLKVYACLIAPPAWASSNGKPNGVPDAAAWRRFVAHVAKHSRGRIAVYGIWNEPNLEEFWVGSVGQYVDVLLKPAYEEIKAADPQARVAGPDLAHLYATRISMLGFLEGLHRRGAGAYLDILSHHLYGADFESKVLGYRFGPLIYRRGLQQMLLEAGFQDKELWVTEMGVDAREGEELQVVRLAQQWLFLRSLGWVKKVFVYHLADDSPDGEQWGLLRADQSAKPAYLELKHLIEASAGED